MQGNRQYSVKVIVASHKKYHMPTDTMYLPLHVGAAGKLDSVGRPLDLGYQKDDVGNNISELNDSFCELTGLYWAWKNLDADYIGLVHYRRHFSRKRKSGFENVLTYKELEPYLGKIRIFVPNKRNYYIETLYSHYAHTHYGEQLDETRRIIADKYPDYMPSYDAVIRHRSGYMFNMMILEKELIEDYCSWLFNILFEAKEKVKMPELSAYQGRYYGRISEIIFNVWLDQKIRTGMIRKEEIMEIPYIHMEKVNWRKKSIAFLKAKYLRKRYEGSF